MSPPFRSEEPHEATTPAQAVERTLSSGMAQAFGWGTDYALSADEHTAWVLREDGTAVAALRIEKFGRFYAMDGFEACADEPAR
ncbi:hypothetical protein J2S59_001169 [Nocardioides massiliensis]|uniref:GNAT family N-acetyltransferase n=2 Tax=Nocardioides massiliensis TaxID=1325935 RepID=A0ABT9NNE7_9ACTN|nr:hypothetical protein [Nocardioides massiliensis]MDP9821360.1 hypothetical protein [Nocardioides massiliensis]